MVPPSFAAIIVVSAIVIGINVDTKTVGDIASIQGGFPPFHIPGITINLETLKIIFPFALIMACVGLVENLLSEDCRMLLANADKVIDVNIIEDLYYKVAVDKVVK